MVKDVPMEFTCGICPAKFNEVKNLNKNMKIVHTEKGLKCNNCNHTSNNQFNMQRHVESCSKRKRAQALIEKQVERAKGKEPMVYSNTQE